MFSLSPRGTSGERVGVRGIQDLLSPALSSFGGGEGEDLLQADGGCIKMRSLRMANGRLL